MAGIFSKQFDRRVHTLMGVILLATVIGVCFSLYALWPANVEAGYAPEQPIHYSHQLHAGTLQIKCRYCHYNVDREAHVAIPSVAICMNCHKEVQNKDSQGRLKPDIARLLQHWLVKKPIAWVKVHDLADFVYFDHSRHLNSGLVCADCHGYIERMERVKRQYGLKMGWCLDCHRKKPPPGWQGTGSTWASTDCSTCHR